MTRRGFLISTLAIVAALATSISTAQGSAKRSTATTLTGAGSSFVFPLVSAWTPALKSTSGISVNYQAIGSGAGISAISSRSVDFGASDAPLTPDQQATCNKCLTIPWAFSATSVAYEGKGLPPNLHITGAVLAKIYLGQIKNWSDPAIKKLNPKVSLPDKSITPIFRSDASGTSYNFTEYLAAVSPEWKSKIGVGTQPAYPAGVGAAKSSGVAALLAKTDGGICFVDVAYATQNHFYTFAIENRAGKFVKPTNKPISAAANLITTAKANSNGLVLSVVDPPKPGLPKLKPITTKNPTLRAKLLKQRNKQLALAKAKNKKLIIAYPICTFTYVIVPTAAKQAPDLKKFLTWALTRGQVYGGDLFFVPIPKVVQTTSLEFVNRIKQA
ncbi:MAG TPA: phosphate ABC transporter substrate-binding protein PstS [Gaiellaceae bacterium]